MWPRRHPRLFRFAILGGSTVFGGTAVAAVLHAQSDPKPPTSVLGTQLVNGNTGNGNDPAARSFLVSGDVDGLAPGATRTLFVTVSNPNSSDISVQSLTVAVGDGSRGCAGSNLRVGALAGPVFVPGRGTAQVSLPVTMLGSAPGTCQGATFPLTYGGSAVEA